MPLERPRRVGRGRLGRGDGPPDGAGPGRPDTPGRAQARQRQPRRALEEPPRRTLLHLPAGLPRPEARPRPAPRAPRGDGVAARGGPLRGGPAAARRGRGDAPRRRRRRRRARVLRGLGARREGRTHGDLQARGPGAAPDGLLMARPERILVVDDDDGWLEFCRVALETAGFAPATAQSGNEALKAVESAEFDLVFTDLQMPPPGDGKAVTLGVKARWPGTDVVLMTAAPSVDSAVAVLKDGACDYLIKPFPAEALTAVAERILEARRHRTELAVERRLREELEAAYGELKRLDKLKEGFLARVSHELNTPLAATLLAIGLLEEEAPEGDPLHRHVARAHDAANRLRAVVEDLLAFVDLQKPDHVVRGEPTQLAAIAAEAAAAIERLAKTKGLEVSVELPADLPTARVHAGLVRKALDHLLKNAVYFNKAGGKVTLSARKLQHWVCLTVSDTGDGIPEAEQDRVFDTFYQVAEYMTRRVGGLGLGLALVKRIVESHKGVVRLESKPGVGTTVHLQFPL
ncbi:hybrid sensor histidine kinase/response regulator [bacterium]|nr:MAG: hybrid sensor histidine kinase/response regulator [bacterium]